MQQLIKPWLVLIALGFLNLKTFAQADEVFSYPPQPEEKLFEALKKTSPFLRTLNISETYSLRAVAKFEDMAYARIYNKITKKTLTLEIGDEPNQGIQLIKVIEPNSNDLSTVAAHISFAGEKAELKYESAHLEGANRGGSGGGDAGRRGDRGGDRGRREGGPSSEFREKYKNLSDGNKKKLGDYIRGISKKYPNMSREERFNLYQGAAQKLSSGGEIKVPQ